MKPFKKVYYFTLEEVLNTVAWQKYTIKGFLVDILQLDDESDLANYQLPSDLTTNASIYNEFLGNVIGRYSFEYIFKVSCLAYSDPTTEQLNNAAYKWACKFISLLNTTYEYYVPIIKLYRNNLDHLMDDIKATSSNKIKYNDTPQNANTSGVYEGDDYINQFTKTEGESTSQMTSKINRLKEIQDGYKNVLADWVKEFEKLFIEGQGYEEQ